MRLRNSNLCAASLLDALDRQDGALGARLDAATALGKAGAEDPVEGERVELLGEIAGKLRELADAGALDRAGVYVRLLRHLAAPPAAERATSVRERIRREMPFSGWN